LTHLTVYLSVTARLSVGGVFLLAAVTKSYGRGFRGFTQTVGHLLSERTGRWSVAAAATVVSAEWAVAALIASPAAGFGLLLAAALLAAMTAAITTRGSSLNIPCNCFGTLGRDAGFTPPHIARNVVLLMLSAAGAAISLTGRVDTPTIADVVGSAISACVFVFLLVWVPQILWLFRTDSSAIH
jgi:hypothetical protein